jgi:hypothetical protein
MGCDMKIDIVLPIYHILQIPFKKDIKIIYSKLFLGHSLILHISLNSILIETKQ